MNERTAAAQDECVEYMEGRGDMDNMGAGLM